MGKKNRKKQLGKWVSLQLAEAKNNDFQSPRGNESQNELKDESK